MSDRSPVNEPPFKNDMEYLDQIQLKIPPNHHFPYVDLQHLNVLEFSSPETSEFDTFIRKSTRIQLTSQTFSENVERCSGFSKHRHKPFKCPCCQVKFTRQYTLGRHIKSNHIEISKPFICVNCPSSFEKSHDLKFHLLTQHPKDLTAYNKRPRHLMSSEKKKELVQNLSKVQCPHCPKMLPSQSALKSHLTKHSKDKPWICKTCGRKYKWLSTLQIHQKEQGCEQFLGLLEAPILKCRYCDIIFNTEQSRTMHHKNQHGIKQVKAHTGFIELSDGKFECKKCSKIVVKTSISQHLISDCSKIRTSPVDPPDPLRLKCTQCTQTFKNVATKWQHESTHGEKHLCPYCPTGFNLRCVLFRHKLLIHQKSACTMCHLDFDTVESLELHEEQIHIIYQINSSTCLSSNQSNDFNDKDDISPSTSQIKAPTQANIIQLYRCDTCGANLTSVKALALHKRRNICESVLARNIECKICGKFFINKKSLKYHIRDYHSTASSGTDFKCPHCDKVYGFSKSLRLHINKKHKFETKNPENPENHHPHINPYLLPTNTPLELEQPGAKDLTNPIRKQLNSHTFSEQVGPFTNLPKPQPKPFKCPFCKGTFRSLYNVGLHIKYTHTEVSKPFLCFTCPSSFENRNDLKCHLLTQHSKDFRAYDCASKNYTSSGERKVNLRLQDNSRAQCPHCPKKFPSQSSLRLHIPKHSKEGPWVCRKCGRNFKCLSVLEKHQKAKRCEYFLKLTAARRFKCTYCKQSFTTETFRRRHLKTEHGIKQKNSILCFTKTNDGKFQCKKCSKTIEEKHLSTHLKRYCSKTKPPPLDQLRIKCSQCPLTFKNNWNKKQHEKSHGDKHLCPYCPTGYNLTWVLIRHKLLIHQKYACPMCDLDFDTLESLELHKQIRIIYEINSSTCPSSSQSNVDNDKDDSSPSKSQIKAPLEDKIRTFYRCDRCGAHFKAVDSLRWHTKACDSVLARNFECEICGEVFKNKTSFKSHILHLHSTATSETNVKNPLTQTLQMKLTEVPENTHFKCTHCHNIYQHINSLRNHIRLIHPLEEITTEICKTRKPVDPLKCKHCPVTFNNNLQKRQHEASHGDDHLCPYCTTGFNLLNSLNIHKLRFHQKSGCGICDLDFDSPEALISHKEVHILYEKSFSDYPGPSNEVDIGPELNEFNQSTKTKALFKCPQCDNVYTQGHNLKVHINQKHKSKNNEDLLSLPNLSESTIKVPDGNLSHQKITDISANTSVQVPQVTYEGTSEGISVCKGCGTTFTTKYSLSRHLKYSCPGTTKPLLDPRKLEHCKYCLATFYFSYSKRRHESSHGDKYLCRFCNTGFNILGSLKGHEHRFHKKLVASSSVSVCGLEFGTPEPLTRHSGEVPNIYKSNSSSQPSHLNETVNIGPDLEDTSQGILPSNRRGRPKSKHSKQCSHCPATFDAWSKMEKHEQLHGDKHLCPYCNTGFKLFLSLSRHKLRCHQKSHLIQSSKIPHQDTTSSPLISQLNNLNSSEIPEQSFIICDITAQEDSMHSSDIYEKFPQNYPTIPKQEDIEMLPKTLDSISLTVESNVDPDLGHVSEIDVEYKFIND